MVLGSWKNLQEGQREDLDGVHPGIKESGLLSQGQGHALATMTHMQRSVYDSGRDTGNHLVAALEGPSVLTSHRPSMPRYPCSVWRDGSERRFRPSPGDSVWSSSSQAGNRRIIPPLTY